MRITNTTTIKGVTSTEPSSSFDPLASFCSPVAEGFFLSNLILKSINSQLKTLQPHYILQMFVTSIFFSRFHIQIGHSSNPRSEELFGFCSPVMSDLQIDSVTSQALSQNLLNLQFIWSECITCFVLLAYQYVPLWFHNELCQVIFLPCTTSVLNTLYKPIMQISFK